MITDISLQTKALAGFTNTTLNSDPSLVPGISKVNIFIGPNNSGKSRLLRGFFNDNEFSFYQSDLNLRHINERIKRCKNLLDEYLKNQEISFRTNDARKAHENLGPTRFLQMKIAPDAIVKNRIEELQELGSYISINRSSNTLEISRLRSELFALAKELQTYSGVRNSVHYERYYIPLLRGLRPIQTSISNLIEFNGKINSYGFRTIFDYFSEGKPFEYTKIPDISKNIFTGLEIYEDVKVKLLNSKIYRIRITEFENFLKQNFFPDKEVTLIPKVGHDVLEIGFDGEERLIHELGDGIQAIIQILYPIFMRKGENALFFIEEPELSLHPGMQRLLLNTLLSEDFASMQFFLTTHSNHFLDFTTDSDKVSVYSFRKESEGKFQIRQLQGPDNHVLNDIGVRNSSVFLANCSIWVEGITDRKYLRRFLELHKKKNNKEHLLEDLHYTFVEYAGSNIIHWDFEDKKESDNMNALRTNNKVFLVADSDINEEGKVSKAKKLRHDGFRKALNENFYLTEGKEIENILSAKVIESIVRSYEDEPKFRIDIAQTEKVKSHNDTSKILKPVYWKRNLGEFIDSQLQNKTRTVSYAEGNTVRDKDAFCEKAISAIESYEDLSDEAKSLCQKLISFIEKSNQL